MQRITLAIILCVTVATATGCGTTWSVDLDKDGTHLTVSHAERQPESAAFVRVDAVPVQQITRADLITEMGKLAGDAALGAELVILAEQAAIGRDREDESARQDALRLAKWFYRRIHGRTNPVNGVVTRARREFGELER